MNLRHSKPSYSYSESAPTPKISQIIVKQDPKLRLYAQLLTNFIERTNEKYRQHQERLRISKSKKKTKVAGKFIANDDKSPFKKSKYRGKDDKSSLRNMSIGHKAQEQPSILQTDSTKTQSQCMPEFPIEFISMLLSIYGQDDPQQETKTHTQSQNILQILEYQCSIHPEYLTFLKQLYANNFYIQGFHPSQLASHRLA